MAMKNRDTWTFAHKYCGKIWYICGWILLVVTIPAMLPVMKADEDTVGSVGTVLCLLQIIPLILSIVPTELALRKNFDKNEDVGGGPERWLFYYGYWQSACS